MMAVKCINCGKEAFVISKEENECGITLDGRSSYAIKRISVRCFCCGIDFEISGKKETVESWERRNTL